MHQKMQLKALLPFLLLSLKHTALCNSYKTIFPRNLKLYCQLLYFCKVKLLYYIKVVITVLDGLRSAAKVPEKLIETA